jgi:biopolymer transport protein ExbD
MGRRVRAKREVNVDLDITSFMNLMVILIPFLLLNAVFTQVSVLQADQPGDGAATSSADAPPPLVLDVYVLETGFMVKNRGQDGHLGIIEGQDYQALNQLLRQIKTEYPKVNSATLRIEDGIPYQQVISSMDAVRVVPSERTNAVYPLFPELQLASVEGAS